MSPILTAHRELVAAMLGEDEGILAVDGTESVGMTRVVRRPTGQESYQAAVSMAYLGRGSAALVDRRLYLSQALGFGAQP